MWDLISVGELLVDLTQISEGEEPVFRASAGGAPANVAAVAAQLGSRAALVAKVGEDSMGAYLVQQLQHRGVDTTWVRQGKEHTTLAVVSLDAQGERSFTFLPGAHSKLTVEEVGQVHVTETYCLHFGSVTLAEEPMREATLDLMKRGRAKGRLMSYDPNYRPTLWSGEEEAKQWMSLPLPWMDLLKVSEEELFLLSPAGDCEGATRQLHELGIALILVTLGERGVYYRWGEKTGQLPGVQVETVDTNGAGDTFCGTVLHQLCQQRIGLKELTQEQLESILRRANWEAAQACTHHGAFGPGTKLT